MGIYKIKVMFISYKPTEIEVVISSTDTVELNVNLESSTISITGVNIVAKRNDRTENAMITMQKKAASVVNGISSQEMQKSGESTAAGALKKVNGVSVQNGKYVYVRGLSDRYSKTILNGAEIPGLDPEKNTVQMDLFPASILKNILVYKSFRPDITGDFSGGLIDLRTLDFPNRFTLNFSAQTGFNPYANLRKDFLTYQGGKTDFLGIDDGIRVIPSEATGNIPNRYEDDATLNSITKSFNKIWTPYKSHSGLNQKYSFSIGNQNVIKGKTIGYFFATQYEHKTKFNDDGFFGSYQLISSSDENLNRQLESSIYIRGQQEAIWTVIGGIGYEFNPQNRINLTVINSHSGIKATNYMVFQDFKDDNRHKERRILEFISRNIMTSQLKGHHDLRDFHELKIDWISSYTSSYQNEPDIRFLQNDIIQKNNGDTVYLINPSLYSNPRRFYRLMTENVYFARMDFELPYVVFNQESKMKFGFSEGFRNRDYHQKQFLFAENTKKEYEDINNFFADENIEAQNGIFVQNSKQDDKLNSYFGYQNVFAAYIMTEMSLSKNITAVYGLRVETVSMHTESYKTPSGIEVLSGGLDEINFLPSINLTATPMRKLNFRLGINRTLARPSFREKAPLTIENREGDIVIGNPNLKQTLINNYDFRVSTIVSPLGESMVLRVLAMESSVMGLEQLGFFKEHIQTIEKMFNEPFGIILLTGPTGSGKSTTLFSGIRRLNLLQKNTITVEEPIEFDIPLLRQTQVNEKAGYTFANAIRYFLRHDPDVILVGEIRDKETADLAMRASITGHLVLSTLHTNDAASSVSRLLDLGVNSSILASSLTMVVAQRLVRRLCPNCSTRTAPAPEERDIFVRNGLEAPVEISKAVGCESCYHSGYKGRTGIYEVIQVDREIQELIFTGSIQNRIEDAAVEAGTSLMLKQALKKVVAQVTTLEEVFRVVANA